MSILVWWLKTFLLPSSPRIKKRHVLVSNFNRQISVTLVYQKKYKQLVYVPSQNFSTRNTAMKLLLGTLFWSNSCYYLIVVCFPSGASWGWTCLSITPCVCVYMLGSVLPRIQECEKAAVPTKAVKAECEYLKKKGKGNSEGNERRNVDVEWR